MLTNDMSVGEILEKIGRSRAGVQTINQTLGQEFGIIEYIKRFQEMYHEEISATVKKKANNQYYHMTRFIQKVCGLAILKSLSEIGIQSLVAIGRMHASFNQHGQKEDWSYSRYHAIFANTKELSLIIDTGGLGGTYIDFFMCEDPSKVENENEILTSEKTNRCHTSSDGYLVPSLQPLSNKEFAKELVNLMDYGIVPITNNLKNNGNVAMCRLGKPDAAGYKTFMIDLGGYKNLKKSHCETTFAGLLNFKNVLMKNLVKVITDDPLGEFHKSTDFYEQAMQTYKQKIEKIETAFNAYLGTIDKTNSSDSLCTSDFFKMPIIPPDQAGSSTSSQLTSSFSFGSLSF
jgi:hypothetical protein